MQFVVDSPLKNHLKILEKNPGMKYSRGSLFISKVIAAYCSSLKKETVALTFYGNFLIFELKYKLYIILHV